MSQVHYEQIQLEELVDSAQVVAVVRQADPPARLVEEPSAGRAFDGGAAPPFRYNLQRLVIDELLRGDPALLGRTAELSSMRGDHIDYYVEGLSSHPIYLSYFPSKEPEGASSVVFLRRRGDRFA